MQKQVQNAILGWVQTGGGGGSCGEAITTEHNKCKRLDSGVLRELENYTEPMSTSSSFLSTRVPSSDPEPATVNPLMSVTWGDMFILELSGLMVVGDGFVWLLCSWWLVRVLESWCRELQERRGAVEDLWSCGVQSPKSGRCNRWHYLRREASWTGSRSLHVSPSICF